MKIVIIGLGTIGKTILKNLSGEEHTITIIDEEKDTIEKLIEKYDVLGIVGNGASMDIQNEASVADANLVIALTRSDELNILACLVAKKVGAQNTIARVRNPDYRKQISEMKDDLGISMVVNPERETANEIFNLINLPSVAQIEHFAEGKVSLVEVVAEKGCSLIGETLISLGRKLNTKVLICAVQRGDEVIIPSGNFMIQEGDKIHFTSNAMMLGDFLAEVNLVKSPFKNIMIVSMFANKKKVKKTITQIKSDDLYGMLDELGINNNVSPKQIVASRIISYIRALANTVGSNVLTLYRLVNNQVEALEFSAKKQERIYNKPLKELKIKKNCLIACIIRNDEVIIPNGDSQIKLGDNVVVVTTYKNFDDLTDVFE